MNYTSRPLDMPTAVEFITNILYVQKGGFIMTDMGRLAIERVDERDPINPVSFHKWDTSVLTEWKEKNKNERADYYIQIEINPRASSEYINILAAAAVMTAKIYNAVHQIPPQEYIDAGVLAFIYENMKDPELYISKLEKEFISMHYQMHGRTTIDLAHYMMRDRLAKSRDLLSRTKQFPDESLLEGSILGLIFDLRMSA